MLFLDIETYSTVDLKKYGVYAYSECPDFEILMCAWAHDDDDVQIALTREEIDAIPGLYDPKIRKIAHGAQFERICFSTPGQYRDPCEWECTQAIGAELGFPQSLADLAVALGGERKDEAGTRLINLFSKPNRGKRIYGHEKPEQWQEFIDYCIQDVVTLRDVHRRMGGCWPNELERRIWETDQRINDYGVLVDVEQARAAVAADDLNQLGYRAEMCKLLGIDNAGSVPQIHAGLQRLGLTLPDLRKDTIDEVLKTDLTDDQRRALYLRQETALVASMKYQALLGAMSTGNRYRGGLKFFGTHPGRWSSKGVQIQNMPKDQFKDADGDHDLAAEQFAALDLKLGTETDAQALRKLVRSTLVGPFTIVDYASIQARILAWWAGETWAIAAFADNRDIYVETAVRMGPNFSRAQGKIAVLALGFNGSVGSLRNMGYGDGMSDEKVLVLVHKWRKANPRIVRHWRMVEEAFKNGGKVGVVEFRKEGKDRHVLLPSGRVMVYRNVRLAADGRILFQAARGQTADTYGGRLTENVVLAMERDILALALVRLEDSGFQTAFHVHDEVVVEGTHDVDLIAKLMCDVPWADGLPLATTGGHSDRYVKM